MGTKRMTDGEIRDFIHGLTRHLLTEPLVMPCTAHIHTEGWSMTAYPNDSVFFSEAPQGMTWGNAITTGLRVEFESSGRSIDGSSVIAPNRFRATLRGVREPRELIFGQAPASARVERVDIHDEAGEA